MDLLPCSQDGTRTPDGPLRKRPKLHPTRVNALRAESQPNSDSSTPISSPSLVRHLLNIPSSPALESLGYGTGVKVFLYQRSPRPGGELRSPWAIKSLKSKAKFIADRIEVEAGILKTISHPHIIGFRGFVRKPDGSRILCLEMAERSLLDYIEERADQDKGAFSAKNILFVVRCVAEALHYLHTQKNLLHGDIKGGNILVIGDFKDIKICDFGVSLPLDKKTLNVTKECSHSYVGTGPWSAREVIDGEPDVSHKTDIFALGCVIFEMLALEAPHVAKLAKAENDDEADSDESDYDESEYEDALGSRPELPNDISDLGAEYERVLSLFYACTEEDPDKRPSAKKVLDILNL